MKRYISYVCLILLVLCGCQSSGYHFDKEFGIRYILNDSNICIHLDTKDPSVMTSVMICAEGDLMQDGIDKGLYESDISKEPAVMYFRNEMQEVIYLRFYKDDYKEIDKEVIYQYLGVTESELYKLKDLLSSNTFKYKEIFEDGEIIDDISFTGLGHQVPEKYYK